VFGGYVDQSWRSSHGWVASTSAFLFSLVRPSSSVAIKLPLNGTTNQTAMLCNSSCGPLFGGSDIGDFSSANSFTDLGHTYTLPDGIKDGKTFFTGAHCFQASEVEVYLDTESNALYENESFDIRFLTKLRSININGRSKLKWKGMII
jgi:hypothetical protein